VEYHLFTTPPQPVYLNTALKPIRIRGRWTRIVPSPSRGSEPRGEYHQIGLLHNMVFALDSDGPSNLISKSLLRITLWPLHARSRLALLITHADTSSSRLVMRVGGISPTIFRTNKGRPDVRDDKNCGDSVGMVVLAFFGSRVLVAQSTSVCDGSRGAMASRGDAG
jgi:hypothetical protein